MKKFDLFDNVKLSVIASPENALKKLHKAQIPVYRCKKRGAEFLFCVNGKHVEKVFAIFDKTCYNIKVVKNSKKGAIASLAKLRAGLIAGALLFAVSAFAANFFVLKIEVSGSGSYLEPEILRIAYDEGAGKFKPFSRFDFSTATGKILALPQVTFCNIQKRGSVLFIDVQTAEGHSDTVRTKSLVSDCDGVVKNIVAICGTQCVTVGDSVKKGDELIGAYTLAGETPINCLAVGYAEIECKGTAQFFAEDDGEESLRRAYASVLLEDEEIISRSHSVSPTDGGFIFIIDFVYLHTITINMR